MNVIKFRKRFSRIERNFNTTSRNTGFYSVIYVTPPGRPTSRVERVANF